MGFTSDVTKQIKARLSLADLARRYLELKPAGNRLVAKCPFHQEKTGSFSINDEEGIFYCFGCHASGDIFDFYGRINGLDFKETLEILAEEAGVKLNKNVSFSGEQKSNKRRVLQIYELATKYYTKNLDFEKAKICNDYIEQRALPKDILENFRLGYSEDDWQGLTNSLKRSGFTNEEMLESGLVVESKGRIYDRFRGRLMFPISNLTGQTIAFGARRLTTNTEEAKYINSSDTPIYKKGEHLYGLYEARRAISDQKFIMITEGYMDVLSLHKFGYANAVGVLGTAITEAQIKRIAGFCSKLELLFDGDLAGRKAALRACEMILPQGLACSVVLFPEGEDIDSLLHKEGVASFEKLRKSAPSGIDFCIQSIRNLAPKEAIDFARNFMKKITFSEIFNPYASALAQGLGITESEFRNEVLEQKKAKTQQSTPNTVKVNNFSLSEIRQRQILSFVVRYPKSLDKLMEIGADLLLTNPFVQKMWQKIVKDEQVFVKLDEEEKRFWIQNREGEAPPCNNEDMEFMAISKMLEKQNFLTQSASTAAALREDNNDEARTEYLRALQDALGRHCGK